MGNLLSVARGAMAGAVSRGARGARATTTRGRDTRAEWRDGKLDRMRESTTISLTLDLFMDGRYSSNTTSDLRPRALEDFLDQAVATTRVLDRDPARALPDPKYYADRTEVDLKLFDQSAKAATIDSCRQKASQLESAMRGATGGDRIVSATGLCGVEVSSSAMAASNGMEGTKTGSRLYLRAHVSVQDRDGRTQPGWAAAFTRQVDKLPPARELGEEAVRRAIMALGAGPIKTGKYPCLIENLCAMRLLEFLTRPLGGRLLQQKSSFLEGRRGEQVAGSVLTILDDPHLVSGLRSAAFDDEGMSTRARAVFEDGVLKNYYLDAYYANKLGLEPTTRNQTNLIFKPGKRDLEGLLNKMGDGIIINSFVGGNSNNATGDFSIGVRGQWVESGKIVRPVSGMNLSGNHLTFWKNLAELGSDPFPYSSVQTPSLRFSSAQFSGV